MRLVQFKSPPHPQPVSLPSGNLLSATDTGERAAAQGGASQTALPLILCVLQQHLAAGAAAGARGGGRCKGAGAGERGVGCAPAAAGLPPPPPRPLAACPPRTCTSLA
eukprot:366114-Chlamydomonas_euryale.AAC.4